MIVEQLDLLSYVHEPVENPLPPIVVKPPALKWWEAKEQYFFNLLIKLQNQSAAHLDATRGGDRSEYIKLAPMRRWHIATVNRLRLEAKQEVERLRSASGLSSRG